MSMEKRIDGMSDGNKAAKKSGDSGDRDLTGRLIGDFRVIRLLGRGGMGEVYLAEQLALHRNVALKVLREDLASDANYLARFREEAKSVASINHPNIVSVYVAGEEDGIVYMALEYVEGRNLRDYIAKKGPLDTTTAIAVMRKVASALQCAAEKGLVHRDIKPENVLLTKKGEVKVADFGLARRVTEDGVHLTQSGMTLGTPLYMSPEQIEGRELDHRTDIYSFGVMCYHMISGRPPFRGETAFAVTAQHMTAQAKPLDEICKTLGRDTPTELCRIVHRMMNKRPEDRFQTAREIIQELGRLRAGQMSMLELGGAAGESPPLTFVEEGKPSRSRVLASTVSQKVRRLFDDRQRRWTLGFLMIVSTLVGAGLAFAQREPELFRRKRSVLPIAAKAPDVSAVKEYSTPSLQLDYARIVAGDNRERGLWAVLKKHPSAINETVSATQDLLALYLPRRDYDLALVLADELIHRDSNKQRVFGYFCKGVVLSRQGKASESNDTFLEMFSVNDKITQGGPPTGGLDADEIRWLARQYLLALQVNAEVLRNKPEESMVRRFQDFLRNWAPRI